MGKGKPRHKDRDPNAPPEGTVPFYWTCTCRCHLGEKILEFKACCTKQGKTRHPMTRKGTYADCFDPAIGTVPQPVVLTRDPYLVEEGIAVDVLIPASGTRHERISLVMTIPQPNRTYGDHFGHPGCHGCQICWGEDPLVRAALEDPNFGPDEVDTGEELDLRLFGDEKK
jgi:hypothetical protein